MMLNKKRFFSVTIDTECDKSINWVNSSPVTYESVLHGIPNILQPLFDSFGVNPSYLLSPEVLEQEDCVKVFKKFIGKVEFGTHLHADVIEPFRRVSDLNGILINDYQISYSPDVEFLKLKNLTELFYLKLGYYPKVFRAGRFAANFSTIKSLEKLGYLVDSSVTPNVLWRDLDGKTIDHRGASEQPYFIGESDIRQACNSSSIMEIPVTIIPRKRIFRSYKAMWLRPKASSFSEMKNILNVIEKKYSNQNFLVYNMMFHSMEIIPGKSPYTKSAHDVQQYLDSMKRLFEYFLNTGGEFSTLEKICIYKHQTNLV